MLKVSEHELEILKKSLLSSLEGVDCEIYCFGSRVNGNPRPDSDLDIAIKATGSLAPGHLTRIAVALEESLFPYHVDVIDFNQISQDFQGKILRSCWKLSLAGV